MKERAIIWLVPRLIYLLHKFFTLTICWRIEGKENWLRLHQRGQRLLICFWHARMLMIPRSYPGWHGYMLISDHRDGGFISDTMHLLGVKTVRGSSTSGGVRAMLKMIRLAKREHCDLGITPDGPNGPREVVTPGVVQLSRASGLPILPVCYGTSRCWRINSWDRFYIPQPFSRGIFIIGDPVTISKNEDVDDAISRVQAAMNDAQRRVDTYFERSG